MGRRLFLIALQLGCALGAVAQGRIADLEPLQPLSGSYQAKYTWKKKFQSVNPAQSVLGKERKIVYTTDEQTARATGTLFIGNGQSWIQEQHSGDPAKTVYGQFGDRALRFDLDPGQKMLVEPSGVMDDEASFDFYPGEGLGYARLGTSERGNGFQWAAGLADYGPATRKVLADTVVYRAKNQRFEVEVHLSKDENRLLKMAFRDQAPGIRGTSVVNYSEWKDVDGRPIPMRADFRIDSGVIDPSGGGAGTVTMGTVQFQSLKKLDAPVGLPIPEGIVLHHLTPEGKNEAFRYAGGHLDPIADPGLVYRSTGPSPYVVGTGAVLVISLLFAGVRGVRRRKTITP